MKYYYADENCGRIKIRTLTCEKATKTWIYGKKDVYRNKYGFLDKSKSLLKKHLMRKHLSELNKLVKNFEQEVANYKENYQDEIDYLKKKLKKIEKL